jgi:hypothetical protein
MAESSKWLEAGEESIFCSEAGKNLPGDSYELPEATAEKFPEIFPDSLSNSGAAVRRYSEGGQLARLNPL